MTDDFFSNTEERAGAELAVRYVVQMIDVHIFTTDGREIQLTRHAELQAELDVVEGELPVKDREKLSRRRAYRRQDVPEVQIRGKNEAAAFVDVAAARPLETDAKHDRFGTKGLRLVEQRAVRAHVFHEMELEPSSTTLTE